MLKLIKTIKTVSNIIYVYQEGKKLYAFKPTKHVEKELLANKLASLLHIKTLRIRSAQINHKKGILMDYLQDCLLLMDYKELSKEQIRQLKKIIIFDIWIGNKDRHTANILSNHDLTILDHEKIFQEGKGRSFIKLDLGIKFRKDYVDIIENLLDKSLTTKQVLTRLGFVQRDFISIQEDDIKNIVKDPKIRNFLISRRNFSNIPF